MFPHYSLGFNRFPHLKRHNDEQASATKAVMKRVPSSTAVTSATSSCVSNADRNTCELPSGRMSLLPIALGIM